MNEHLLAKQINFKLRDQTEQLLFNTVVVKNIWKALRIEK